MHLQIDTTEFLPYNKLHPIKRELISVSRKAIRTAFLDTIPVMTGYVFLGFGFGIVMHQSGYGGFWPVAMSLFIYAGSMQYMAVGLLTGGASILTTALTTLVVNARHLFYGISMIDAYKNTGKKKPYLIFALTDETYSLVSQNQAPEDIPLHTYCLLVSLFDQCWWVGGTILGALAGDLLPLNFEGIEFVLTALFVTIFVEQWISTKNHFPAITGLAATTVCLMLFGKDVFLIPSMCLIATILIMAKKSVKENDYE